MGGGISKTTQSASERKLAERERLVVEMEQELGLASEHPEDLDIISLGYVEEMSIGRGPALIGSGREE
jgi:hypothetical protein